MKITSLISLLNVYAKNYLLHLLIKIERTGMKLGLHRMEHILELFDHPEKDLKVIHVAGTMVKVQLALILKTYLNKVPSWFLFKPWNA